MKHEKTITPALEVTPDGSGSELRARYYAAAGSWAQDAAGQARASRNVAWVIAACACACAVAEGFALAALTPLKTVVPYTILVDRRDGTVELDKGVKLGPLAEDKALTQSLLVQYVLARETFDAADLKETYKRTLTWSTGQARTDYLKGFDRNDPASLLRTTPPTTVISPVVRSVSLLSRDTALVRFESRRTDPNGVEAAATPVTAVMTFRFTGAPAKTEERFLNPLGFKVSAYRRDVEAPVPPPPAPPPAPVLGPSQ